MRDPDLQIRWGGGGEGGTPKILFLSLGPQFGLKIKRGEGGRVTRSPPLDPPL